MSRPADRRPQRPPGGGGGSPAVLVTTRSFGQGTADVVGALEGAGLSVVRGSPRHEADELARLLPGSAAWIAGAAPVTREHLAAASRLRVIARYGVGTDAVDRAAAAERGITVTNTPGANTEAVADLAVGLLLALLRRIPAGDRAVRAGRWRGPRGRELGALTLGVVGFGRIGRAVAARARGFGGTVLACDPAVSESTVREHGAEPAGLDRIAEVCDAVTLHTPGGRIADAAWLAALRPGAVLVNTARAALVDEDAVAAVLRSGHLAGYAADMLAAEWSGTPASPLLAGDLADRVVLTPHAGAQTTEAVDRMGEGAVRNVLAVLSGAPPPNPVPPPEPATPATGPVPDEPDETGGSTRP